MRGSLQPKPKAEQRSMFSDSDLSVAQGQGIAPPRDFVGDVGKAASTFAGRMRSEAEQQTRGVIMSAAERFRQFSQSGDKPLIGDMQVLFQGLSEMPELRSEFTDEELTAIQVAAGRRFK